MPIKRKVFYFCVPLLLLGVSWTLSNRPYYNWDIFPYMAVALASPVTPFDSIHAEVFRQASHQLPRQDWLALSQHHPELISNPDSFHGILKYFEIKPLYILSVQFIHFLGFSLVDATYLPSIISYFLITLLLFWWLQKMFPLPYASVLTLVMASLSFLIDPARYSSPDMLCAFSLILGLFLITEISLIPGLLVASIAIFVRPDACLFLFLLSMAFYKTKKLKLIPALFIVTGASLISLSMIGSGMLKEFLFTSADYSASWSAQDWAFNYLQSLWKGISSVTHSNVPLFSFIAIVTLYVIRRNKEVHDHLWTNLIAGTLGIFIIRYLLHPVIEDRFLISSYLLILIGLCKTLAKFPSIQPLPILEQKT